MVILPPPPIQEKEFSSNWRTWLLKVKEQVSNLSTIAWSSLSFTGSNLTDIVTRNHNDTSSKQGGTTNEYYHLTSAQHTLIASTGLSVTITTAKLTALGSDGSMTFTNGILTAQTAAT